MALTDVVQKGILFTIKNKFYYCYLLKGAGALALDVNVSTASANLIDGDKLLAWGTETYSSPLATVLTTNSATSNPLNYSVPSGSALSRLLLVDSFGIVVGIIPLVTPPSYAGGDGAYYVRGIALTLGESV